MDVFCDLQVDVNGEEIFLVDKKILSSYCGRISKLFGKSKGATRNTKVIFHDFPGGAESFELMTRFCYNSGKIEINPFNVSLLYCIAHFMEMNKPISKTQNLLEQTEKYLKEIRFWTWSEIVLALKQCQDLLFAESSSNVLHKYIDSLTGRIALTSETSPCPSTYSPDSSGFRLSTDTRSTESVKNGFFRATWWFEDLVALNPCSVEILIKAMLLRKFDNGIISKFLFYYQKSRFFTAKSDEKLKIIETVVDMLCSLEEQSAVSCKSLFGILRVTGSLNISKEHRSKLENMIGLQLDQATLDNLLVPSPSGTNCLYDVNLVMRFLKSFLDGGVSKVPLVRLKKVASLMESYLTEVAPDPCLKPLKFLALVRALPDSGMDTYDGIYHAVDMYLEVHPGLSEEEKRRVCCGLNYGKLSSEACNHLAQNPKFPSKSTAQALTSQQNKLKSLLDDTNGPKPIIDSSFGPIEAKSKGNKDKGCEQIVIYAQKLDVLAENEKLKAHLQGMQWRVMELEKACKKMQSQMSKMMKSRLSRQSSARSLPSLCS
ncbi:hypothetical protein LguiB_002475 [Lonicera macranthoides]